ncbi:MAG: ABC transporter permease [Anaerolineaceae bacterium]|nr:ABC transporter permease [Anaerolineaceae bacterium]
MQEIFAQLFGPNPELREIIGLTLVMSVLSTLVSGAIGIPLGTWLGLTEFKGKRTWLKINSTLMGLPPVLVGLLVFLLLSHSGPLGKLRLLFSLPAMVIAQVILITPIITGMTANLISLNANAINETCLGLRVPPFRKLLLVLKDFRKDYLINVLAGFGRSIAEVGAVQMVGGNIQYKTRVMTTAIMMQTNMGQFEQALALGFVLLCIAFLVNFGVQSLQKGNSDD